MKFENNMHAHALDPLISVYLCIYIIFCWDRRLC